MFGRTITLEFEGQKIDIFVLCLPETPMAELRKRAKQILIHKIREQ